DRQTVAQCLIKNVVVTGEQVAIYYVLPFAQAPQVYNSRSSQPEGTPGNFYRLQLADLNPEPLLVAATGQLTGQVRGEQVPGLGSRRRPVHGQMEATDRMFLREGDVGPEAALAKELGRRNIRVNTVAPGHTDTEGTRRMGLVGSEQAQQLVAATPLG